MDPVARRGAVFVVGVLLALIGGYFVGKASVPSSPDVVAPHSHSGGAYSLALESSDFPLATQRDLRFHVLGPGGAQVTEFPVKHDKQMHVVVVRTDLTGYRHVHPSLGADGTWSVPLTLDAPGTWRVFADFATVDSSGQQVDATAGGFVSVGGVFSPAPMPSAAGAVDVSGVRVTVDGSARPGGTAPLTMRVSAGPLDRYLGAYGHLVVVRSDDLAFVHVHPEDQLVSGAVRFWVTVPGPGTYRAYFDFSIGGKVRTAEFTLAVPADNK